MPASKKNAKNNHLYHYHQILDECKTIHDQKNHDYAGDEDALFNLKMVSKMGLTPFEGVCVRLTDKFCRLMMFCKRHSLQVSDENIEDTLKDIINYSAFAIEFLRDKKAKKQKKPLSKK